MKVSIKLSAPSCQLSISFWQRPTIPVFLSAADAKRSEAAAESKDPYSHPTVKPLCSGPALSGSRKGPAAPFVLVFVFAFAFDVDLRRSSREPHRPQGWQAPDHHSRHHRERCRCNAIRQNHRCRCSKFRQHSRQRAGRRCHCMTVYPASSIPKRSLALPKSPRKT